VTEQSLRYKGSYPATEGSFFSPSLLGRLQVTIRLSSLYEYPYIRTMPNCFQLWKYLDQRNFSCCFCCTDVYKVCKRA